MNHYRGTVFRSMKSDKLYEYIGTSAMCPGAHVFMCLDAYHTSILSELYIRENLVAIC